MTDILHETLAFLRQARSEVAALNNAIIAAEAPHKAAAAAASAAHRAALAAAQAAHDEADALAKDLYAALETERVTRLRAGIETPPIAVPDGVQVRRLKTALITDPAAVPRIYCKVDAAAVKRALEQGDVPGAERGTSLSFAFVQPKETDACKP